MQRHKFNVVTDGQWGSCGKGAIASALAIRYRPEIISTTNMANAGHTAVNTDGTKFIAKALPTAAILHRWTMGRPDHYSPYVIIGPTAAFHIDRLLEEVAVCDISHRLAIHPRAGVITEAHRLAECDGELSTRYIASTQQGCGAFLADKIMRRKGLRLARDYPELKDMMADNLVSRLDLPPDSRSRLAGLSLPELCHRLMTIHGHTMLHEGSQGFSLDINHGSHYPHCTSRGTTAIQNAADMGIGHHQIGDVYLVIRPYPIRVGNIVQDGVQVGYSGDCYEDQHEMTWEEVAKEAGMPQDAAAELFKTELTTVTKRLRRVFSFSERQVREAAIVNGATRIALNFANYISWSCVGCNNYDELPTRVLDFIHRVEDITQLPVTVVGTGPRIDQVCIL